MRLTSLDQLDRYDCLYVSAHSHDAPLACAVRLRGETQRGLRVLLLTLLDDGDGPRAADQLGVDHLCLGLPDARHRGREGLTSALSGGTPDDEACLVRATGLLDDIGHRVRARHIFLPLGVGGHVDHLLVHQAGLHALRAGAERDLFLYEERPDAFVPGMVWKRLAEMGARLPPAAAAPRRASLLRFLWSLLRAPHVRTHVHGIAERTRLLQWAVAYWRRARAWRPQKALGPRLQPMLHQAEGQPPDSAGCPAALLAYCGAPVVPGTQAAAYARRLGAAPYAERYWLVLPDRDDVITGHPGAVEIP